MPVFNNILAGASGQAGGAAAGYEIERSVRFNSSDSAYLSKNISGSDSTFTISCWIKLGNIDSSATLQALFSVGTATYGDTLFILSDGRVSLYNGSSTGHTYAAGRLRDPSAWYHVHVKVTSGVPVLYINSEQFNVTTGYTWDLGGSNCFIGAFNNGGSPAFYWNGLIADFHCVSNQALDPTDFGEFDDNGVWQPIEYAGTYGTNGFHLPFSDNSSASALGTDDSGNGNNWTVNNISILQGDGNYVKDVSGSTADNKINAFDGNLNTYVYPNTTITWSPSSLFNGVNSVSSLRIYATRYTNGGGSGGTLTVNSLSGSTSVTVDTVTRSWHVVNVTDIQSIVWTATGSNPATSDYVLVFAIEVNNVILLDNVIGYNNDSLRDSPTNGDTANDTGLGGELAGNYCTWNPLNNPGGSILSNGNLDCTTDASSQGRVVGTLAVSSGKYYWECTPVGIINFTLAFGIAGSDEYTSLMVGSSVSSYSYSGTGDKRNNSVNSAYGASWGSGDTIGIALDLDSGTLAFYKNGASQGTAFTGISGSFVPAASDNTGGGGSSFVANFGQRPFAYSAPSGYKALCTANLPDPDIADGSKYFDIIKYDGNGTTQTLPNVNSVPGSGLAFSPDFVWTKLRGPETDYGHRLADIVRGTGKVLYSNNTATEASESGITAFNSDGYDLGSAAGLNNLDSTFVAWTWDAGSSTVSNTDGSITSTVRANPSAGFSVVTYTVGNNTSQTIGHGLGVSPQLIIVKERNQANNWQVYHTSLGNGSFLYLNATNASATNNLWNNTSPTSTVFSIRSGGSANFYDGKDHVAYCFAPVEGYSAFGSYTGNGLADGPFVYTGFRPRWILFKQIDTARDWLVYDTARDEYNSAYKYLYPNLANSEGTNPSTLPVDVLSSGFKLRSTNSTANALNGNYVYAAFAEHPFKHARAR
jgi:hypothetical protein